MTTGKNYDAYLFTGVKLLTNRAVLGVSHIVVYLVITGEALKLLNVAEKVTVSVFSFFTYGIQSRICMPMFQPYIL